MISQTTFNAQILESLNNLNTVVHSLHEFAAHQNYIKYKDEWEFNESALIDIKRIILKTKEELLEDHVSERTMEILGRID